MTDSKFKSEITLKYHPLLPLLLKALAVILFFYWGLTHLIYPEWYLVSIMGITSYDPSNTYAVWSSNLMGVLNAAFAITIWRASSDPLRYKIIIDMIILVTVGTMIVFLISLLRRNLSPREWINVVLMAGSLIALAALYPRQKKLTT